MSLAQLNTIDSHPLVSCSFHLVGSDGDHDSSADLQPDVFIAGATLDGVLHLTTQAHDGLSLGRIEVELVAREGPGLPPSNAVVRQRPDHLPKGYHVARKGSTSFPLAIALPPALPASFSSRVGSITYTLYATVDVADEQQRRILRISRSVQVVPPPAMFSREWLQVRAGRGEVDVGGEGSGRVEVCVTSDPLGAWALEGGMARVHVAVSNGSGHVCVVTAVRLLRRVIIDFGAKQPGVVETVEAERALNGSACTLPYAEADLPIDLLLPSFQRSTGGEGTSIRVCYALHVILQVGEVSPSQADRSSLQITASVPVEILHPASLPADLWLEHQARLSEARGLHHAAAMLERGNAERQRRWSTPVRAVSALLSRTPTPAFSPPQQMGPIPGLPPRRLSLDHMSVQAYSQPPWVVHALPAVTEEAKKTKAERTSRHLRETSGSRGRSVSPLAAPDPAAPILISPPRFRRPPSVAGPRPAPSRSTSNHRPAPFTPAIDHSRHVEAITPPLLSPMPQPIEPNSYFDQQVHSLSPEEHIGLGKLSPATIKSLEDFAESLATSRRIDKTLPDSPDEMRSKALRPLDSPVRERRSVMRLFSIETRQSGIPTGRPEATRRESSERRVEVETCHARESSVVVEIHDEASRSATPEDVLSRLTTPQQSRTPSQTYATPSPHPHPRSRSGSLRGRGGQVAAVRDKFAALERAASPPMPPRPHSAEKRIRRKSVPLVPLISASSASATAPAIARPAQAQRHSMAIGPGRAHLSAHPDTPAPLTRPLNIVQQSFLRHSMETPTEPLVLEPLRGSQHVKDRFERVDLKDESKLKRRGAVGRLKALIERFERW